jgi:threonine dehydrogenase-like Zn-dependent dehydrogenase
MYSAGDVRVENVPDAHLIEPTDALVRVTRAAICGSDLWPYKSMQPSETGRRMGHEFIGVVESVGDDVRTLEAGDLVVAPFLWSDGTCVFCREGLHSSCLHGGRYGDPDVDGGQGEAVRVPLADGSLVTVPGSGHSDEMLGSLLTLSDVMATGHHAAVCADVREGGTVAVVGDGAVGLSGVLAAKRLGAERIIALSRNPVRQEVAREFGATDVVEQRGEQATEAVLELTKGVGVDATLECVGTGQAMRTALSIARPGSMVGYVGVPHGVELPIGEMFFRNKGVRGGSAPARAYIPELLPDVLEGRIKPGRVLDYETDLDGIADAYAAMDERRAIKSLVRVGSL